MNRQNPIKPKRGGKREGAGRKTGSGLYKENTIVKRLPESVVPMVDELLERYKIHVNNHVNNDDLPFSEFFQSFTAFPTLQRIPIAQSTVRAGFPSPAEPYISDYLDFNDYLVSNASATIGIYASGDSMLDAGISEGDLLIVDRSMTAKHKDIVIADVNNEFTVKRLHKLKSGGIELHPENTQQNYPIIRPNDGEEVTFVGVVTFIIKRAS